MPLICESCRLRGERNASKVASFYSHILTNICFCVNMFLEMIDECFANLEQTLLGGTSSLLQLILNISDSHPPAHLFKPMMSATYLLL